MTKSPSRWLPIEGTISPPRFLTTEYQNHQIRYLRPAAMNCRAKAVGMSGMDWKFARAVIRLSRRVLETVKVGLLPTAAMTDARDNDTSAAQMCAAGGVPGGSEMLMDPIRNRTSDDCYIKRMTLHNRR